MNKAKDTTISGIVVKDKTDTQQIVVETSPDDPTTVTLAAGGTTTITPTGDCGPYTIDFQTAGKDGVVPDGSSTATVALATGAAGLSTTTVVVVSYVKDGSTSTATSTGLATPATAAGSEFTIDDH